MHTQLGGRGQGLNDKIEKMKILKKTEEMTVEKETW